MSNPELPPRDVDLFVRSAVPNLIVLPPGLNRSAAMARAGARAREYFGETPELVTLNKARLLPFWRVKCVYKTEYDCVSNYTITAGHPDTTDIYLSGKDVEGKTGTLHFEVNPQSDKRSLTLLGNEHRITTNRVDALIRSYKRSIPVSALDKAARWVRSGTDRLRKKPVEDDRETLSGYVDKEYLVVPDEAFGSFFERATVGEVSVFQDMPKGDPVEVVPPDKGLREVVGPTIQRSLVKVEFIGQPKAELDVNKIDLYYHPVYQFTFRKKNIGGDPVLRHEQLDAITGEWFEVDSTAVQPSSVDWGAVLLFTTDTMLEILKTFAPTSVRVFAIVTEKGIEHFLRGSY